MSTYWRVDESFHYLLRVDESSTEEEIEAEIEYWLTEISMYGVEDPYRAALLKAVRWMTELLK